MPMKSRRRSWLRAVGGSLLAAALASSPASAQGTGKAAPADPGAAAGPSRDSPAPGQKAPPRARAAPEKAPRDAGPPAPAEAEPTPGCPLNNRKLDLIV